MSDLGPKPGFHFDPVPPKEALDYFRAKGFKVGFDYRDVWREEHAIAFTVAKAMNLDVLQTIRGEVDRALAEGRTLRQFKQDLTPMLQKLGWWGVQEATDPKTGEPGPVQLGSPRRLHTIYRANLRTARAAGQWERIQRTKRSHPFLRYALGPSREHREQHLRWNGLVLSADDAWWHTHMPPNGWGCKCRVRQLSRAEATRLGGPGKAPPVRYRNWRNRRTGQLERVPVGIDPGWDHNPGVSRMRAFTPPENDTPPRSFPSGVRPPPLPPPREAQESRLLPNGEAPAFYARRFLSEFGAGEGSGVVHIDQVGQPVAISDALFKTSGGRWKSTKRGRGPLMLLLADTVKEPDEIWWSWVKVREEWHLYRRYVARWQVAGSDTPAFAMFEWSNEGWSGTTAFGPDTVRYLENQRTGMLAWRRKE